MITREDAASYLGVELEYDDGTQAGRIDRALNAAVVWLKGAVGNDVDLGNPLADELMLMAVGEFFEFRQLTDHRTTKKVYAALNRMAADMLMQLRYASVEYGGAGDGS